MGLCNANQKSRPPMTELTETVIRLGSTTMVRSRFEIDIFMTGTTGFHGGIGRPVVPIGRCPIPGIMTLGAISNILGIAHIGIVVKIDGVSLARKVFSAMDLMDHDSEVHRIALGQ